MSCDILEKWIEENTDPTAGKSMLTESVAFRPRQSSVLKLEDDVVFKLEDEIVVKLEDEVVLKWEDEAVLKLEDEA